MPKASWNIKDFSGGFNSFIDKRDIEDNQSSIINNLIAPNKGVLKLAGGFIVPGQFDGNEGGFGESGINLNTAFYLQPSSHFIKYYRGIASNAGSSTAVTITSQGHGLTTNTIITIIKGIGTHATALDIDGDQYKITKTAWNTFTIVVDTAIDLSTDNETWYFCIGGNYIGSNTFSPDSIKAYDNPLSNQLVLKANNKNQFGFYNVNEGFFVGSNRSDLSVLETNAWLFDTQYLWNVNQYNSDHPEFLSNAPNDYHTNHILEDGYYIDGVFRAIETRPKYWQFGHIRRPVGYYYIEKHKKFNAMDYYSGWYPLRTHCLSPAQYQENGQFNEEDFFGIAGVLTTSTQSTIAAHAGNITDPTRAYQVNIEVDMGTEIGDWNFASGSEHQKLGLGISYIYDDINWENDTNFSQESNITRLTSDGTSAGNSTVTIGSGSNLQSLSLVWKVHKGVTLSTPVNNELFSGIEGAIADNRSSNDNGDSNIQAWNPRIVGAKVYLMETAEEVLEDPLYLATINFYGEESKHGISKDFNNQSSTSWTNEDGTDLYYQGILNIVSIPILEYSQWNGYEHYEQINTWYKTSAIVNRKLYAGNVSYFDETNPLNLTSADKTITSFPDRILISSENKFDVLPVKRYVELDKNDGQDIVKLQSFNKDLLIYKTNDLFVLDCSSPDGREVLKFTFYGNGVSHKNHISSSSLGIFSINKLGLFVYDGETNTNLLTGKIDADYWSTKIFSENSNVLYDPQYNLVFITSDYNVSQDNNLDNKSNLLIYNLTTQSFFYKSQISNTHIGFLTNGLNIDGRLYTTSGLPSPGNEQFIADNSTAYVKAESPLLSLNFSTTNSGTHGVPSGGTCPAGLLSTDAHYMKVQRNSDGKWILLNKTPIILSDLGSEDDNVQSLANEIDAMGDFSNHMDDEYYWNSSKNGTNVNLTIFGRAANGTYSSDQNFLAEDITSINAGYGTSAFAFANNEAESTNTSTAGLNYGNLDSFNIVSTRNATARVNGVWQIQFSRDGNRGTEVIYILELKWKYGNGSYSTQTFKYDLAVDYFAGTDYVSTPPTSGFENTDDDNLTTSFRKALALGVIRSEESGLSMSNYMDIGDITTSGAGTAKFSLTMNRTNFYSDFQVNTYIDNVREDFSGKLLQWHNVLPKDANGNSLMNISEINLETKDIDFNEPGIRKKVYKAYITYTQGDGNIKCYYQANQSGTWTAADVKDASGDAASTANQLNDSSAQTRAELSFGTGGNNIYSFALKFESVDTVTEFEINDISIIYRLKRAK